MKFLVDHDVYAATTRFLVGLGHDTVPVNALGLAQAADEELLRTAQAPARILVTRDRDYGGLVFVKSLGAGVIYLRVLPSTQHSVHTELEKVLKKYTEAELNGAFFVVEPDGHRFRKLAQPPG